MFIGHYGIAYALKPVDRQISLGLLFLAVQFVDILWAVLIILGIERVNIVGGQGTPLEFIYYPFTHSLAAAVLWAAAAYTFFSFRPAARWSPRGTSALVLASAVLSHFLLDVVVHRPDLPLVPFDGKIGLALWDYPLLAWAVELLVFLIGLRIYSKHTRAVSAAGKWAPAAVALLLLAVHTITLFGPPPESVLQIGAFGLAIYALAAGLAWWTDHERA